MNWLPSNAPAETVPVSNCEPAVKSDVENFSTFTLPLSSAPAGAGKVGAEAVREGGIDDDNLKMPLRLGAFGGADVGRERHGAVGRFREH